MEKRRWPIFPHIIGDYNPQGTFYQVPKGILTSIAQGIKLTLWDLRGIEKQILQKTLASR